MTIPRYGSPCCGPGKKASRWLDDRGIPYRRVNGRETTPEPARVAGWLAVFGA